jgi:hypothetical protein
MDFGLIPFMSPSGGLTPGTSPASGSAIDPARAVRITAAYAVAFFDQYLNGKAAGLLNGASPDYAEITFEK